MNSYLRDHLSPYLPDNPIGIILSGNASSNSFSSYGFHDDPFPLTSPFLPMIGCAAYLLVIIVISPKNNSGVKTGGIPLKIFSVIHNFIMMVFSFLTFYNILPIVLEGLNDLKLSAGELLCVQTKQR